MHVFIVDRQTFKLHLEYLFAGIGASNNKSPFLIFENVNLNPTIERMLISMIADISRIRVGDKIIFYLQSTNSQKGKLFGIFKAESKVFFDENDDSNYLKQRLGKGLSYRIIIRPWKVFSKGIEESKFLDDLFGKSEPWQMCWSLIYRKLKGNRGCTMITEYEARDLENQLKIQNMDIFLKGNNFSYDEEKGEIIEIDNHTSYEGRKDKCEILDRLIFKLKKGNAFETHLQAYILQNYDKEPLKSLLFPLPQKEFWIGNEVACGVSMQKIDLLIKQEDENNIFVKVIELKDEELNIKVINYQFPWYLKWISQYFIAPYLGSKKRIVIIPCLIAKWKENINFVNPFKDQKFKTLMGVEIENLQVILFREKNNALEFKEKLFN